MLKPHLQLRRPRVATQTARTIAPRYAELVFRAVPNWNPQNVPDPQVMPSPDFNPLQTVTVQLRALQENDEPWLNHGLQTMYEFAEDAGSMDRSFYFGFGKDLYHFDHFMGMFRNKLEDLMLATGFEVVSQEEQDGVVKVVVNVTTSSGNPAGPFQFTLVKKQMGRKKGSWMTKALVKL